MVRNVDRTVIQSASGENASELVAMASLVQSFSMTNAGCVEETIPAAQKSWAPLPKRGIDLEYRLMYCVVQIVTLLCACFLSVSKCNLLS